MQAGYRITVISARQQSLWAFLQKLWQYRSMMVTLTRRDLKIKYAQTAMGILWTVLQPLTGLIIFTVFFGALVKLDTGGIPYALFAFTGMVSWFFFSQMMYGAGTALVQAQHLIQRIYFPRLILLLAKVLVALTEFAVSLLLLVLLLLFTGTLPGWPIFFFPLFILFTIIVGVSVAVWLSALTIRYRDFQHIIPYLVNFGIWLTPVFYPDTLIPSRFHLFLFLNPMAASIAGFRWALLGGPAPEAAYLLSIVPVSALLLTGLNYFRKVEGEIADFL